MKWERIESNHANHLDRCRVSFGWLVMSTDRIYGINGNEWRTSITYVFDPFKTWKP